MNARHACTTGRFEQTRPFMPCRAIPLARDRQARSSSGSWSFEVRPCAGPLRAKLSHFGPDTVGEITIRRQKPLVLRIMVEQGRTMILFLSGLAPRCEQIFPHRCCFSQSGEFANGVRAFAVQATRVLVRLHFRRQAEGPRRRENLQIRPMSNRMIRTTTITPTMPLGPYPQPRLYPQFGSAPIRIRMRMMRRIVPTLI